MPSSDETGTEKLKYHSTMVVLAFMNLFRDLLKFLKIISIQKFHFGEENMRI